MSDEDYTTNRNASMRINESQGSPKNKKNLKSQGGKSPRNDKEMAQIEIDDNTDLQDLKRKLAIMKQMPQPENKEEMISFLM